MNKLLLLFSLLLTSFGPYQVALAFEGTSQPLQTKIFMSYCSHFGDGVSLSFQSCVNSNFSSAARSVGGYASYCSNFGDEVSFSFTSCINRNFQNIQSRADGSLYLRYCSNFDRERLSYSYVSCVNSNFSAIQRYAQNNQAAQ